MTTQIDVQLKNEEISALMDGHLRGAEFTAALSGLADTRARECWHVYHLVGDVLRSSDLAACGHDRAFVERLSARLAQEARPSAVAVTSAQPPLHLGRPAANDHVFRWKLVSGVASFAAVAAIGWGVLGGIGPRTPSGAQLAQQGTAPGATAMTLVAAPSSSATGATVMTAEREPAPVMLRDARLDELLAAHRQAMGASALGNTSAFLRNATFEGPGR